MDTSSSLMCAVCLDEDLDIVETRPNCKHSFCSSCFKRTELQPCPMCRTEPLVLRQPQSGNIFAWLVREQLRLLDLHGSHCIFNWVTFYRLFGDFQSWGYCSRVFPLPTMSSTLDRVVRKRCNTIWKFDIMAKTSTDALKFILYRMLDDYDMCGFYSSCYALNVDSFSVALELFFRTISANCLTYSYRDRY